MERQRERWRERDRYIYISLSVYIYVHIYVCIRICIIHLPPIAIPPPPRPHLRAVLSPRCDGAMRDVVHGVVMVMVWGISCVLDGLQGYAHVYLIIYVYTYAVHFTL